MCLYVRTRLSISGLILHEEHIELLTEDFKVLKREREGKILLEGTLHFMGKRQECMYLYNDFENILLLSLSKLKSVSLRGERTQQAVCLQKSY